MIEIVGPSSLSADARRCRRVSPAIVSTKRGEQRHRGDDRRADGEALGDGLGGVTDGVEAHHDALGLAVELAGHLGDTGGVVGHRTERVLGDDHAGGCEHAHAGERDEVEARTGCCRRRAAIAAPMAMAMAMMAHTVDSRPRRRCPTSTVVAGPVRAASAISRTGRRLGRREVLGEPAHDLGEHETDR